MKTQNINCLDEKIIRLLIVDDVLEVREEMRTVLQLTAQQKHLPIQLFGTANNGLDALQKSRILKPDVILMDLEMPIMDGYEATRRIKAELPNSHVIILSIHNNPTDQQRALDAGADDFMVKGVSLQELINKLIDYGNIW